MKKKHGFTLIELLAVIVILAVIALIATPMVLNTIEKARKGAFEQTLNGVVKAVDLYKAQIQMTDELSGCRYFSFGSDVTEVTVRDGKTYYPLKELSIKGSLPTEGEIKVCRNELLIDASDGSYSGRYEDEKLNVTKGDLASSDLTTPIIDTFNITSTTDKIIVTVAAHSQSVGGIITNYYYKIDDGKYNKTTEPSYVFEKLKAGQEYTITIMVENKSGITTEESKKITTKSFGELTIDVEDSNKWTSSKNVTITGTTEEYKIEYNIRKYNEETKELEETGFNEYTDSFTLDTMATNDYPILIIARYNDNGTYSNEKTYTVVNIDTTSPTNTKPVVNVSTTKPTSEASVVVRQDDSESGLDESTIEYGYSLDNVDYTWQASFELKKLKAGTKYYVKTRVTNNVGKTIESEATEYTPGEITTCNVEVPSGWATSKTVTITGVQTGVELQYQVGATAENGWNSIENEGTVKVEENTSVYCRLWDGTTAGGTGTGIVEGIDNTGPSDIAPTVVQSESDARTLVVTNNQNDLESNLDLNTLLYGYSTDNVTYTWQASNTFGSLVAGTTYYFKTKVSNNVGMEVISNYTIGKIAYTGIAAGTYSAGTTVNYAGVDWLVINDNGDNITLITKSNIGTGVYSKINDSSYVDSVSKIKIDEWFNNNSILLADQNVDALVADSSTGYYARLPRSNELSTNIPNGSGTPFWTMSSVAYGSDRWMIVATNEGTSEGPSYRGVTWEGYNLYYDTGDYMESERKVDVLYSGYSEVEKFDYYIVGPSVLTTLGVSLYNLENNIYYSKNKAQASTYEEVLGCHAEYGVTTLPVSANYYYAVGDNTCQKYVRYKYYSKSFGIIGYRPVITVKEK